MPLISIITINYNDAVGLEKTMQSVINQDCSDYEHIIIDGGSTDASIEVIQKHQDKIAYWVSEKDAGIYNAMNKGIQKATGDFLFFLNSADTLVDNNVLSTIKPALNNDFLVCGNSKFGADIKKPPKEMTLNYLLLWHLPHQAIFFPKSSFKSVGLYNENYKIISDWIWYFEFFIKIQNKFRPVDVVVSNFDLNGFSSKNATLALQERNEYLETNYPMFHKDYLMVRGFFEYIKQRNKLLIFIFLHKIKYYSKLNFFHLNKV